MDLARFMSDVERRLRGVERPRQMSSSSIETPAGDTISVPQALASGVAAETAVAEVVETVSDAAAAALDAANIGAEAQAIADAAQATADAAALAATAAGTAATAAVAEVDAAVSAANAAALAAAEAKAKADSVEGTASSAQSAATAASEKADAVDALTAGWKKTGTTYINGGAIFTDSIGAGQIAADTILGRHIKAGEITAGKMAVGTITAESGVIGSLDAALITVGKLTSAQIATGAIKAVNIEAGAITGSKISADAFIGKKYATALSGTRWEFGTDTSGNYLFGYAASSSRPASLIIDDGTGGLIAQSPDRAGNGKIAQLSLFGDDGADGSGMALYADAIVANPNKRFAAQVGSNRLEVNAAGIEVRGPLVFETDLPWQNLAITDGLNFSPYNTTDWVPRVKRSGSVINIQGALRLNTAAFVDGNTRRVFAVLPTAARPDRQIVNVHQGSSENKWTSEIDTSGNISVARYGPDSATVGTWLPFNIVFMV